MYLKLHWSHVVSIVFFPVFLYKLSFLAQSSYTNRPQVEFNQRRSRQLPTWQVLPSSLIEADTIAR